VYEFCAIFVRISAISCMIFMQFLSFSTRMSLTKTFLFKCSIQILGTMGFLETGGNRKQK
jgi:hypothetical protein